MPEDTKNLHFNEDVWTVMAGAIHRMARAVGCTMGPGGKNVLIQNESGVLTSTRDGVTVARSYEPVSRLEKVAVDMARQAATQTVEQGGDGTTCAIVLVDAMLHEARYYLRSGNVDLNLFIKGMEMAVARAVGALREHAVECRDLPTLTKIARIAANHDEKMGEMVAMTVDRVGKDGLVVIDDSFTDQTTSEWKDGMDFDVGMIDPHFNTPGRDHAYLHDALVLLYDDVLDKATPPLLSVLDLTVGHPVLIMCHDCKGEALQLLAMNAHKALNPCVVRFPGFGPKRTEVMGDVACMTKGRVTDASNLTHSPSPLGQAGEVVVTSKSTVIVGGSGDRYDIVVRAQSIKDQIAKLTSDYEKEQYRSRAARMVAGTATIRVGAPTEVERQEKKFRVEDSVHACKSALEEGILPGAGVGLARYATAAIIDLEYDENIRDAQLGMKAVRMSLSAPMKQIYKNAGLEDFFDNHKIRSNWIGIDARDGTWVDFRKVGILDSVKCQRAALEFAFSVVKTILSADVMISIDHEEVKRRANAARAVGREAAGVRMR